MSALKEVAERIRTLREIMDISQEEMAEKTDLSLEEYRKYESGETDFTFIFIFKCAKALSVSATDLIEGVSPTLSSYTVTRRGNGLPIMRRQGLEYFSMAPLFKDRVAEPFWVKIPYDQNDSQEIHLSTHTGQEMDIVIKGQMKIQIGEHVEILNEGDCVYYNSAMPHGMIAAGGAECEFYAIVMGPVENVGHDTAIFERIAKSKLEEKKTDRIYHKFITTEKDEDGILSGISFHDIEHFNFAYDVVDAIAAKNPNKLAMLHVDGDKTERRFTFGDMSKYSSQAANYFASLGIRKGDRVMLILKRHYQFWFSILGLHKLGAIVIPATNQLVEHDLTYRFQAAGVKAILCTADGDVSNQVDLAAAQCPELETKILVAGEKEGWHSFDADLPRFSDQFPRPADSAGGEDKMLMFFTSGTTGYPKIATHNFQYPLGHFITARYWHHVNPNGLHLTISDTGWAKAMWGKLYGQWLCEAGIFVYNFDRFDANDILPMFKKYNITTFCAPPTMYRFFIREDLSRFDLSSIEYSTIAGEALNPEVYEQWKKATGLDLMEGFGQSESTVIVGNLYGMTPKPGSMGKPSPLYDVDIVDEDGNSLGVGETGEIVIRNQPCGLFRGYYRDEEKTADAFCGGVYHTGDTAWRDEDGYFWYVGRIDDVIKSSGYRIGPFEIESVIMELPYVLECAVTAAPDPIRGQVVKASIVLTKNQTASDELKKEIQNYVKKHTAPYKYPRIVEFLDEMPKTVSGKIKRNELREK